MYEQIIDNAINLCILLMEGFLAFYLLAELLPANTEVSAFEPSEYDEHLSDDFYFLQFMENKVFTMKDLQTIAKNYQVPGWSRLNKEDLARELYNSALL